MASTYFEKNPNCSLEGGNTHAFMDQWIGTLKQLGTLDAAVAADHPFCNVYTQNGKRTYAAYNFSAAPLSVTFSDGIKLIAKPKSLTVKKQAP
jgi:hypothetical protein